MKYRIVKNGLGQYAVQERKLFFWSFVNADQIATIGSSSVIATWTTYQDVQCWVDRQLSKLKAEKDRKTWEVVE